MGHFEKLLITVLSGSKDKDVGFNELCKLLETIGFRSHVKGSHHIYYREDIPEIINIQPSGSKVKPYQVKQVRHIIVKYKLGGDLDV